MRYKKQIPWFICAVLLLSCVCVGLATRNSFTDVAHDPNLMNALYPYSKVTPESLNQGAEDLQGQAELVALVKTHGDREYWDNAFKTSVDVLTVYQGDKNLQGKSIFLYEPVRLEYAALENWNNPDAIEKIKAVFPDAEKTGEFIYGILQMTEAMDYHAPLQAEKEYLVFLTSKKYPKESEKYRQTDEFNFIESVYAIVDTSPEKDMAKVPSEYISLKEAMRYPVLLSNLSDINTYMQNCQTIQKQILN